MLEQREHLVSIVNAGAAAPGLTFKANDAERQLQQLGPRAASAASHIAELLARTERNGYSLAWTLWSISSSLPADQLAQATVALSRASGSHRLELLARIGQTRLPQVMPVLRGAALSGDARERMMAGIALGFQTHASVSDDATRLLVGMLKDDDREARTVGANGLRLLAANASAAAVPALLEFLRTRDNPYIATLALAAAPAQALRPARTDFEALLADGSLPEMQKQSLIGILARIASAEAAAAPGANAPKDSPGAGGATNPLPLPDPIDRVMFDVFGKYNAQFVCLLPEMSRDAVRAAVLSRLPRGLDPNDAASAGAIAQAIYTTLPCPFSPDRPELRRANAEDVVGEWVFPESSQALRYGPKSALWRTPPGMPPINCEVVSYVDNGTALLMRAQGAWPCPTLAALRDTVARGMVERWKLVRPGRLRIDRTEIADHVEEWDVFVVVRDFEFARFRFAAGELVAYLRREKGNESNVATQFRHLQRLQ